MAVYLVLYIITIFSFCAAEYTTKTKPNSNQLNLNLKKTTEFRVRIRFRFWLSVYSADQNYRWLIFLVVPLVFSPLRATHVSSLSVRKEPRDLNALFFLFSNKEYCFKATLAFQLGEKPTKSQRPGQGDEIINCSKLLVEFLCTKLVSLTNRVQLLEFYFSFSRDAAPKELANCY